jgi:hypothetical protein
MPAVHHDPSRRDWIELHLRSPADLDRLGVLVAVAMAASAWPAESASRGAGALCGTSGVHPKRCALHNMQPVHDCWP